MVAGLPNITGNLYNIKAPDIGSAKGAFTLVNHSNSQDGAISSTWGHTNFDFDASRCSAIYGNSSTVTPNSLITKFYISY